MHTETETSTEIGGSSDETPINHSVITSVVRLYVRITNIRTSNTRRTFYIVCFPAEKLRYVLNSRNVYLSNFF